MTKLFIKPRGETNVPLFQMYFFLLQNCLNNLHAKTIAFTRDSLSSVPKYYYKSRANEEINFN